MRYDNRGSVLLDLRTVPALRDPLPALWSEPLPPHSLQIVEEVDLRLISVAVKK